MTLIFAPVSFSNSGARRLQRLLDRAGLRHDVHRDAVELPGLRAKRRNERKHRACDRRRYAQYLRHAQLPPDLVGAARRDISVLRPIEPAPRLDDACKRSIDYRLIKTILAARSARQRATRWEARVFLPAADHRAHPAATTGWFESASTSKLSHKSEACRGFRSRAPSPRALFRKRGADRHRLSQVAVRYAPYSLETTTSFLTCPF